MSHRSSAYSATELPDKGFHVLLAVAAIVDEVDLAVLQDVTFLLDRRDIGRHEVIYHSWLASTLRRNLQHMLACTDVCSLTAEMMFCSCNLRDSVDLCYAVMGHLCQCMQLMHSVVCRQLLSKQ